MKWIEKVKAHMKHKHDWQTDKWGKRCSKCGLVRTKQGERIDAKIGAFGRWLVFVLMTSFAITTLFYQLMFPITGDTFERMWWAIGSATPTVFMFLMTMLFWMFTYMLTDMGHKDDKTPGEKT